MPSTVLRSYAIVVTTVTRFEPTVTTCSTRVALWPLSVAWWILGIERATFLFVIAARFPAGRLSRPWSGKASTAREKACERVPLICGQGWPSLDRRADVVLEACGTQVSLSIGDRRIVGRSVPLESSSARHFRARLWIVGGHGSRSPLGFQRLPIFRGCTLKCGLLTGESRACHDAIAGSFAHVSRENNSANASRQVLTYLARRQRVTLN